MITRNILVHYARKNVPFLHGGGKNATDQLISHLKLMGNEKILEIGFGTGATQVRLKSLFPDIDLYGLEVSSFMIQSAVRRLKFAGLPSTNLHLIDHRTLQFPFDAMTFDIVIYESVLSIVSIREIKENLQEVRRVLKPGGMLVLNESVWLDSISGDEISKINKYCINKFGITMAQSELHSIDAWKTFLFNERFTNQLIVDVDTKFKLNSYGLKDYLSQFFSYFGKLYSLLLLESDEYKKAIKEFSAVILNKQYIEAKIFLLKINK